MAIDELVQDIIDRRGVTPIKLGADFTTSGHRVISAKLVKRGVIDLDADEPRYVDEPTYSRWMRSPLRADDVILTSEAPLGEVAYLRSDVDWVLGQRLFAIRTDKGRLHGRYLYYSLQADPSRSDLQMRATGTTAQGVRQAELRRVRIPLPPLAEQHRIAEILGALDDKIEINRQMVETLEETVHTVSDDLLRLEDARWVPLGDLVTLERSPCDPSEFPDVLFQHYSLPAFDDGRRPSHDKGSDIKSVKAVVSPGVVLLSKLNPGIERVWLPDVQPGDRAICSTEFLVLRPVHPVGRPYLYALLRSAAFRTALESLATGTSGSHQRAPTDSVMQLPVPRVDDDRLDGFDAFAGPMLQRALAARSEANVLASLRDTLLPRLLGGHLAVLT